VIWLYVPPFSWTSEQYEKGTHIRVEALFSSLAPPENCPESPVLFSWNATMPQSMGQVSQLFREDLDLLEVALGSNPTSLATRVKSILDKSFADDPSMAKISKKLKTSGAVLSRQFKSAFGFTPMHYKRGLRITAAMYHLLSGKAPVEAAFLSGYRDVGRFYKQFKQYTQQTPDSHRIKKSKNAKT
jgi:AraC-like DNA-binding protein